MATKVSQQYAFTITLSPKLFKHDATKQYDITHLELAQKLMNIAEEVTLIAELTKRYNIHYHGIITFDCQKSRNLTKYFHDQFRSELHYGFVDIKPITEYSIWLDYIKKELKETQDSISRRPLVCDQFNALPTGMFEIYGIEM